MADRYYQNQYTGSKIITWKNYTDTSTPLSAANLQKSHSAINDVDQAVRAGFNSVDLTKLDKTDASSMISNVEYNTETGVMIFHHYDNSIPDIIFNTNLQKLVVNFTYNPSSQQLVLTQADGTEVYVNLSDFIATPDVTNSDTVAWTINQDGSVSADIIDGSITEEKLEVGYLASIMTIAGQAHVYEQNADYYSKLSQSYANGTSNLSTRPTENVDNADYYRRLAQQAQIASGSSMHIAGEFAEDAEAWAWGKRNGQDVPSTDPTYHNSAKDWADKAREIVIEGGADMEGATASTDGKHGYAPKPLAGDQDKYLSGGGEYKALPTFRGVSGSIASVSGMLPAAQAGDEDKAFFGDGTWRIVSTSNANDIIAPVESNSVSTHAYAIDDQFIYNNKLYTATQAIGIGNIIVPNTNCKESDTLVEQIAEAAESGSGGEQITWEQWQQLTPEQQATGDYFIIDAPVNSSILPVAGFDERPTEGSYNPVFSGGVFEAIKELKPSDLGLYIFSSSTLLIGGIVPPSDGDPDKVLKGDGTWGEGGAGFRATIEISTSSSSLYGQTITIKKSGTTVGTTTFSQQGTASYTVREMGTYTVECTYSGQTYSDTVTVTSATLYTVTLDTTPDGSTVTPTDDIQTWLACAGITDKSYTTLAEVLADSTTLAALMLSHNAVDYLVRSTSWAKSENLVPTMTSNTTPSGECFANSTFGSRDPWKAFDGVIVTNDDNGWLPENTSPVYCGYHFTTPTVVRYAVITVYNDGFPAKTGTIQGSNDNSTWTDLGSFTTNSTVGQQIHTVVLNNNTAYEYYRVNYAENIHVVGGNRLIQIEYQFYPTTSTQGITDSSTAMTDIGADDYASDTLLADATWRQAICDSQYFESVLNVKVPTMTSNTTPSGEVVAYNPQASSSNNFESFSGQGSTIINGTSGYIQYQFTVSVNINLVFIKEHNNPNGASVSSFPNDVEFQVSNDGTNFTTVKTASMSGVTQGQEFKYIMSYEGYYSYFRMNILNNNGQSGYTQCGRPLQFYGRAASS